MQQSCGSDVAIILAPAAHPTAAPSDGSAACASLVALAGPAALPLGGASPQETQADDGVFDVSAATLRQHLRVLTAIEECISWLPLEGDDGELLFAELPPSGSSQGSSQGSGDCVRCRVHCGGSGASERNIGRRRPRKQAARARATFGGVDGEHEEALSAVSKHPLPRPSGYGQDDGGQTSRSVQRLGLRGDDGR